MSDFDSVKTELIDKLSNLTVLQVAELVSDLEERWGVSAQAAAAPVMIAAVDAGQSAAAEQTEFNVVMTGFGDKKIQVIKEVRAITNLGLKEAKTLVEEVPAIIKDGVSKEEAEKLKAQLEASGATIEIK
jgi:large subunit ribosomal protein L7/L12